MILFVFHSFDFFSRKKIDISFPQEDFADPEEEEEYHPELQAETIAT